MFVNHVTKRVFVRRPHARRLIKIIQCVTLSLYVGAAGLHEYRSSIRVIYNSTLVTLTAISIRSFHCGHVIAESKGGDTNIANLRPVCAACNLSMGVMSMNEFTTKFFGWSV